MKNLCMLTLMILLTSCGSNKNVAYTNAVRHELAEMWKTDQKVQTWDESRLEDKNYLDSMTVVQDKVSRENCETIKGYLNKYGFPGLNSNDKVTSMQFWTIVQHSDHDVPFQAKVLKLMRKQLDHNNVNRRNYAYLYDRVHKNLGKPQRYGTQIEWINNEPTPYKLEHPEKVDERRKSMELEPMEEYLFSFIN